MRWGCQRNTQRSFKTLLFVFSLLRLPPSGVLRCMGRSAERRTAPCEFQTPCNPCPGLRQSGGTRRGALRHRRSAGSHASFQRLCYAIGVFFGCSLRLLTLEKWRFSNRSTPDNAQFVRRAPHHHTRRRAYTGRNRPARRCRIS